MKTVMKLTLGLTTALLLAVPAHAMTASQKVEVERKVTQADGSVAIVTQAPEKVVPGDTLIYTVEYHNDKSDPVENFRLDMPVPAELIYLEGTAQQIGVSVQYSADKGQTYKNRDDLTVLTEAGGTRTALSEDITTIRWTLANDIAPGESGNIQFKGKLK